MIMDGYYSQRDIIIMIDKQTNRKKIPLAFVAVMFKASQIKQNGFCFFLNDRNDLIIAMFTLF